MTTFIYALKEPDTGEIRYIGKANNPKNRLRDHLTDTGRCHRVFWIQSLVNKGSRPLLEILDEVPIEYWQQWEVAYIEFFREEGNDLVNGTDGGEGLNNPSKETRERIGAASRGRKLSPETIAKIVAQTTGQKRSPEVCSRIGDAHRGKIVSEETRAKQSAAHLGVKLPVERRERQSKRMVGKPHSMGIHFGNTYAVGHRHTPEHKQKMSKIMSIAMLGNTNSLGHRWSDEERANMSIVAKRREAKKKGVLI